MMDLDEAIQHAEEVVEKHTKYNRYGGFESCDKCAEEHRRLVEWLKELKAYRSRSEIPNTCGDAISREELIEALNTWDKFGYAPTNELVPLRGNVDKDKYVPYIHYDDVIECIKGMPSVTPQQRTGQWIAQDIHNCHTRFECSECGYIHNFMHLYGEPTADYTYCPYCGAKMEVEE